MKKSLLISAAFLCASAPALAQAQDAPADATAQEAPAEAPASEAPSDAEAPATISPEPQAASFSDTDIQAYVKSLTDVQRIDQDTALAQEQKQAGMVEAIKAAGLTPQKFNEISVASQSDPGLQQRIQDTLAQTPSEQTPDAQTSEAQPSDAQTPDAQPAEAQTSEAQTSEPQTPGQ